jgi:hypothetical protein
MLGLVAYNHITPPPKASLLAYSSAREVAPATLAKPDHVTQVRVSEAYGKLPLHFEVNQGQTNEQVKFLSRGGGCILFLALNEAVLALHQPPKNSLSPVSGERARVRGLDPKQPERTVLRMQLVGTNPNPQIVGLDELPNKSNYFIGNDPKKWRTNIPNYARVQYQDIYPGIDLVYYGNQRQLEYDFIISPGVNSEVIRLSFQGADKLEIDAQGDLILHTVGGEIRQHKPLVYQEVDDVRQTIPGRYVLKSKDSVGFQVAAYDTSRALVVDPVLS